MFSQLQDVEPGRPVRSQLASAAKSPEEAFRRMKNKSFVVETKFDGMQLHGIFQILSDPSDMSVIRTDHLV